MASFKHPGVYVQPQPTQQAIAPVGTSTAVFVGAAESGPINVPTQINSWTEFVATFGAVAWGRQLPSAVYAFFALGGASCFVVRAVPSPLGALQTASLAAGALTIRAASGGAWGDNLAVSITDYPATAPDAPQPPTFAINVVYRMPALQAPASLGYRLAAEYARVNELPGVPEDGWTSYQVETFAGFTAADLQKDPSNPAKPSNIEARINGASLFIRIAVSGARAARPANISPAAPLRGGVGDSGSAPLDLTTALDSLRFTQGINLLVTPETALTEDLAKQRALVQHAASFCETRQDLFLIADTPYGLGVDEAVAFKTGVASGTVPAGNALTSSYGAIYDPWILAWNPSSNTSLPTPPSGAMAGIYAATDAAVGVWSAPAGITSGALSIATGLTSDITDADQNTLNPAGVNAIRSFVNYGICAYGARTLSTDPDYIYISVRRLFIYIEQSLRQGLQWVVFEPNDAQLWASVTRDVSAFLTTLWQSGGLFGDTASSAFFVQCDAGNNPPSTQADGQLFIDIGVAPVHPAEFILIRIQLAMAAAG